MSTKTRLALEDATIATLLFTAFVYLYYLVAGWGISDHLAEGMFKDYVQGSGIHLECVITGLGFGALLSLVNRLAESRWVRRLPFVYIVLLKTALYLVSLALMIVVVNVALAAVIFSTDQLALLRQTVTVRFAVSGALWLVFTILAINFVLEVRRKIGPGNVLALLTGRYQRPHIEERIFLFLDLDASTTIAERLGPEEYSRFLRHCFHDLTEIVLTHGAQIYQYVGDEVILTWRPGTPRYAERCVEAHFAFAHKLEERGARYEKRFGMHPVFRGGVAEGPVTAAEVGDIKRDIAYHGDPLNTAARLLERCKTSGESLLVSGSVKDALTGRPDFPTQWQGDIVLRGKKSAVPVYAVSQATARGG